MSEWTRPNVNYAKDWLNHSFLCPGLVWSQKEFHFGCDHQGAVNNHFPVYWGLFRHGDEQPNNQPGDPSASLLLTSVRRQYFAKMPKIDTLDVVGDEMTSILNIL